MSLIKLTVDLFLIVLKKSFIFIWSVLKSSYNTKNLFYKLAVIFLLSFFIIIANYWIYLYNYNFVLYELSKDDSDAIEKYVKETSVDEQVGQILMVGIPGDIANILNNKFVEIIISDLGIGNLFANRYNYYDKDYSETRNAIYINKILAFHNHLQTLGQIEKVKIPLLIATDYEGYSTSSSCIEKAIILPPEALTLASTQDPELIRLMGQVVGYQLRSLGIHMIMGPVLDIDVTSQGDFKSAIQNRSFGSDAKRVFVTASHYIRGLQEGHIQCIGKHYPGHGAVVGNPHGWVMPTFEGSADSFVEHLLPYQTFMKHLDGLMTAHINVNFMINTVTKPITFSEPFVSKLLRGSGIVDVGNKKIKGFGYKDKIIITDDLSDMGSILRYMEENNKSFSQIAIEAFEAGHDMLLFSHVEVPKKQTKRSTHNKFTIEELKLVKKSLVKHISGSNRLKEQLRNSVRRILTLKAKINKTYNFLDDHVLGRDSIVWSDNRKSDITNPKKILGDKYSNTDELLRAIFQQSLIIINKTSNTADYNISSLPAETKIVLYINEKLVNLFENAFSEKYKNVKFVPVPNYKYSSFAQQKQIILNDLKSNDLMFYTLCDVDDRNVLEHLFINANNDTKKKLVILLHTTPSIIANNMLSSVTILGNFSNHPLSYYSDIEILSGNIEPKNISNLPINLGTNFTFHNINSIPLNFKSAKGFIFIPFYSTDYESRISTEAWYYKLALIFSCLMLFVYFTYKYFTLRSVAFTNVKDDSNFKVGKWYEKKIRLYTNQPKMPVFGILAFVFLSILLYLVLKIEDPLISAIYNKLIKYLSGSSG